MNQRAQIRADKLEKRCVILSEVIIAIRPVYIRADPEQKALIETMIGAAIWYIPKPLDAWTGIISHGALKAFHPDSGLIKPRLSEEHVYPRKVAARMLLEDTNLNGSVMTKVFREKYGRLHYITSDENKIVQPYQRANVFESSDDAYSKAGIKLITVVKEDLRLIKKRDRTTIDKYLAIVKDA